MDQVADNRIIRAQLRRHPVSASKDHLADAGKGVRSRTRLTHRAPFQIRDDGVYSLVATDGMSAVLTDDAGADPIPGFPVIRHQASGAGVQSDTMPMTATRVPYCTVPVVVNPAA